MRVTQTLSWTPLAPPEPQEALSSMPKAPAPKQAERFLGVSIAEEKELIIIVSKAGEKAAIMKAIAEQAGPGTPSGAISFSLPISAVAGLRVLEDD